MREVTEFDNYEYPTPPKETTPEMRRELERLLKETKEMAKRHREELHKTA